MKKTCSLLVLAMALVTITFYSCKNEGSGGGTSSFNEKSKPATEYSNKMALAWIDMLCDQVRFQRVGPPPAARRIGLSRRGDVSVRCSWHPGAHSLVGQLKGLENLPEPDNNMEYSWPTVLNNCAIHCL
jgi:hypothetical protein